MAELSKNQIEYINKIGKAELERNNGTVDLAVEMLKELWKGIPEPKYVYKESFLVAWSMIETAIGMKNIELMKEWMPHVFNADPERYDSGEREMYAGQVEYECGNFAKSYEYFDIAKKKSSGRCFRKCDKKYKDFYSDYASNKESYLNCVSNEEEKLTELSDEIYEKIEEYSEQGNDYCDNEEWEKAIICFNKALGLLPDPKEEWEAATWIYAALGDMFYFLEKYEEALDNLNYAMMCPNGMANPFILLRLGEAYYELDKKEQAKKYLLEAYMMEGTEIFEDEDEKYFDLVRELLDGK